MLRIIAGTFKSRRIFAPRSRDVRPTSDRVKEALFQILGPSVEGASVLDLYAGSGNLGCEALSRGAARCCFVERDPACCAVIRRNVELLGVGAVSRVMRIECARAVRMLGARGERFDLVLADPPYNKSKEGASELKKILRALDRYGRFALRTMVVTEHFKNDQPPSDLMRLNLEMQRRYGDTMLSFFDVHHGELTADEADGADRIFTTEARPNGVPSGRDTERVHREKLLTADIAGVRNSLKFKAESQRNQQRF